MNKFNFKAGDKVRFRPELNRIGFNAGTEAFEKGEIGVVDHLDSDKDLKVVFPCTNGKPVFVSPSDVMCIGKCKTTTDASDAEAWEFHSATRLDVDHAEILDSLTRKNPLALIERGEHYMVAVKQSLMVKAQICMLSKPSDSWAHRTEKGTTHTCKQTDFAEWISWAKVVKHAKWPKEYHYNATVKIHTPTI